MPAVTCSKDLQRHGLWSLIDLLPHLRPALHEGLQVLWQALYCQPAAVSKHCCNSGR
jgi:hypothetical protein